MSRMRKALALRIAIDRDWLPDEVIVLLPRCARGRAYRAMLMSGRRPLNDVRRLEGIG